MWRCLDTLVILEHVMANHIKAIFNSPQKCKALRKGLNELAVEGATCPAERRKEGKAKGAPTMNAEQIKELDRWFLKMHNKLYEEHDKLAKVSNGFMGKILEAAMGAHDRAWCQLILSIPFELHQEVLNEEKEK